MESFFQRTSGRITLVVGGINLALMGVMALTETSQDATRLLIAAIVPLSIAVGIYVVGLATTETPTPFPIALACMYMFLGGVAVYAMEQAPTAGHASGVLLIVLGACAGLLGVRPLGANALEASEAS